MKKTDTKKAGESKLGRLVGKHVTHRIRGDDRDVILMAVSGKHAMVRRPHCAPYVALETDLLLKGSA